MTMNDTDTNLTRVLQPTRNGKAKIPIAEHGPTFLNNVFRSLDYHTRKSTAFGQPRNSFHYEAIY